MTNKSFLILRIGLAIVFIWVGVAILQRPEVWGGFLAPWAMNLLPFSLHDTMLVVGIFDIIVGALLIIPGTVRLASALAFLRVLFVLIASGITDITIRDVGLLAMSLALFMQSRYR